MIVRISAVSVVTSPFSFLILLIWVFSLFLWMSLANGLSILFIFSKNQLLVLLIFAIVLFLFHLFLLWSLWFLSFYWLWVLFVLLSLVIKCSIRLFIWDFSCFLRWDWIPVNFPLRTAFASSVYGPFFCFHVLAISILLQCTFACLCLSDSGGLS